MKSLEIREIEKLRKEQSTIVAQIKVLSNYYKGALGTQDILVLIDATKEALEEAAKKPNQEYAIQMFNGIPDDIQKMVYWGEVGTPEFSSVHDEVFDKILDLGHDISRAVVDYIIKTYKEKEEWKNKNLKWN